MDLGEDIKEKVMGTRYRRIYQGEDIWEQSDLEEDYGNLEFGEYIKEKDGNNYGGKNEGEFFLVIVIRIL